MVNDSTKKQRGSIILVDGDDEAREAAAASLKTSGFEVNAFSTGTRALRFAESQNRVWRPIMVVVDCVLPEVSGFEIVRRFSNFCSKQNVPLVMTARTPSSEDEAEASTAGAFKLAKKPFTGQAVDQLLELVKMRAMRSEIGNFVFDISYT